MYLLPVTVQALSMSPSAWMTDLFLLVGIEDQHLFLGEIMLVAVVAGTTAINHPVLTIEKRDDFLVVDRSGTGNNCDEHFFKEDERLILAPHQ